MKIANSRNTGPNFKGYMKISRVNNEPNATAMANAIKETVNSFMPIAKKYATRDFPVPLFHGTYKDPKTKAVKVIISTDENQYFGKLYGPEKLEQKINELDKPLFRAIKAIKARFKTPEVKNACLIDQRDGFTPIHQHVTRIAHGPGRVDFVRGLKVSVGVPSKSWAGNDTLEIYTFRRQYDGSYLSSKMRKARQIY